MDQMFFKLSRAKQAKAIMLHLHGTEKQLTIYEYAVLCALGQRKAPKTVKPKSKRLTPTIINTCFPNLDSIARDAATSKSSVRRAIAGLVAKDLITKEVIHNFQWKGRKDHKPQHNGVRYKVTPIWVQVPLREYGDDFDQDEESQDEISAPTEEDVAEVERVLAEPDPAPSVPKAAKKETKRTTGTAMNADGDEVFVAIQHHFKAHPTIADHPAKKSRGMVNGACLELASRALDLGDIRDGGHFLWWLTQNREPEYRRLMTKVEKDGKPYGLGSKYMLLETIDNFWDEYVAEKGGNNPDPDSGYDGDSVNDEYDEWSHEEYDTDDEFTAPDQTTVAKAKAAAPEFEFDDEDEDEQPSKSFVYGREAFVEELQTKADLLRRPAESFTIKLNSDNCTLLSFVRAWLKSIPYGQQIVHREESPYLSFIEIKWRSARYIVEHAAKFINDDQLEGNLDTVYKRKLLDAMSKCFKAETVFHAGELELVGKDGESVICENGPDERMEDQNNWRIWVRRLVLRKGS